MTKPYICIIGGANMDIHGHPANTLKLHDSNPGTVQYSPGGVARNIAENLARLGNNCRLIAPVGNDYYGRMLLEHGAEVGINMQHMIQLDRVQTSSYLSILDEKGDLLAAVNDMTILNHFGASHLQNHQTVLQGAAIIMVDTNLKDDALAYVMNYSEDQVVFVDTVSCAKAHKIKPYLNTIHTLKPSLSEAETLCGFEAETPQQLPALADWFHQQGVKRIFISLGDAGVFYSTDQAQGIEKAIDASDVDVYANGAGDAFLAGLTHAWLREWPLLQSVRFALSTANLTLSHPDTIHPDMSDTAVNHIYTIHYAQ